MFVVFGECVLQCKVCVWVVFLEGVAGVCCFGVLLGVTVGYLDVLPPWSLMFVDVLVVQIRVLVVCWLSLSRSAVLWVWQAALLVVCIEVLLSVDVSVMSVCTYVLCWSYRCVAQCVCVAVCLCSPAGLAE